MKCVWLGMLSAIVCAGVFLGGCGGSSSNQDPLKVGLIHWWKFDRDASDSAGNLSATPVGPVAYTNAVIGKGIVFNGSTTGISLPPATDMQFQSSFSISVWASLYSYPPNIQLWATIILDGDDRFAVDPYYIQVSPGGNLQFTTTSANRSVDANGLTFFPLNQFVFITGTYDKAAGIQTLYVNGAMVDQHLNVPDLTPVVPLISNQNPGIGIGTNNGFPNSAFNTGWNGAIDDLRIYNRALSAAEVSALYRQGTNP